MAKTVKDNGGQIIFFDKGPKPIRNLSLFIGTPIALRKNKAKVGIDISQEHFLLFLIRFSLL